MATIQRWEVASTPILGSCHVPHAASSHSPPCWWLSVRPWLCEVQYHGHSWWQKMDDSHGKMASASLHFPNLKWVHYISENKLYAEPQLQRSLGNTAFFFHLPKLCSTPRRATLHRHHIHCSRFSPWKGREVKSHFPGSRDCRSCEGKEIPWRRGRLSVVPHSNNNIIPRKKENTLI